MKTKLMAVALLAASSLLAAPRVAIGVGIGVPVAPAPVVMVPPPAAYMPPCPGPGYVWIGGSWIFRGAPAMVRPGYFRAPVDHGPRDFRRR
jgi:hypothetical protein